MADTQATPDPTADLAKDPEIVAKAQAAGQTPEDYIRDNPGLLSGKQSTADAGVGGPLANAVKTGASAMQKGAAALAPGPAGAPAGSPPAGTPDSGNWSPAPPNRPYAGPHETAGEPGRAPHPPEMAAKTGPVQQAAATAPAVKPPAEGPNPPAKGPQTPEKTAPAVAAPAVDNPGELQAAVKKMTPAAEEAGPAYEKAMSRLDALGAQYQAAYKEQLDSNAVKELGEKLGGALARIGAGIQGQRTGYDTTTGLKFDVTDWTRRNEQALGELKAGIESLGQKGEQATRLEAERKTQAAEAERQQTGIGAQKEAATAEVGAKAAAAEKEQAAAQKRVVTEGTLRNEGWNARGDTARDVANIKGGYGMAMVKSRDDAKAALNAASEDFRKSTMQARPSGDAKQDERDNQALNAFSAAMRQSSSDDPGVRKAGLALASKQEGPARAAIARRFGPQDDRVDRALKAQADSKSWFGSASPDDAQNILKGPGAAPAASTAPGGQPPPAVGTVMQGHRFKGGNPGDPASWEPVQ